MLISKLRQEYLVLLKNIKTSIKLNPLCKQYLINRVLGHSLGGALATHAAISLQAKKMRVFQLYTFGSPRVGDVKFSEWFERSFADTDRNRVTHGHDPVPHLPPHSFGFNHVPH